MDRLFRLPGPILTCLLFAGVSTTSIAGELTFSSSTYSGAENATTISITLQRSGDVSAAAAVTILSADDTASSGEDYLSVSSTVNWSAGDGDDKSIELSLIDDSTLEGDEALLLNLADISGDTVGAVASASVIITDYEQGQLQFDQPSYSAFENANSVEIIVSRINGSDGELAATYVTADDTALLDIDYEAVSGNVLFANGELHKSIFVALVNDEVAEVEQSFRLELTTVGADSSDPLQIAVTIEDDDSDFTPALSKLAIGSETIEYSATLDMSQVSLINPDMTLLDVINAIPVLSVTELVAQQLSDGSVEIDLGEEKFLIRPLAMIRAEVNSEQVVTVNPDQSGYFSTSDGVNILFQPSLSGIDVLQSTLIELGIPELTVTEYGNITIQSDQGPPPLEVSADGEVVIKNSYYDRYNIRPQFISTASTASETGVIFLSHPIVASETMLAVITASPEGNRRQLLGTAPVIADELFERLWEDLEVEDLAMAAPGLVTYIKDGEEHGLFADYIIRRVQDFSPALVGLTQVSDINGDNLPDLKMIYSSGDEQYLFDVPLP